MTKKISSTKPCGRNSKIYNGAFLKCFSIVISVSVMSDGRNEHNNSLIKKAILPEN